MQDIYIFIVQEYQETGEQIATLPHTHSHFVIILAIFPDFHVMYEIIIISTTIFLKTNGYPFKVCSTMMTPHEIEQFNHYVENQQSMNIRAYKNARTLCASTEDLHSPSLMFHLINSDSDGSIKTFYVHSSGGAVTADFGESGGNITVEYAKQLIIDKLDLNNPPKD